MDLESISISKDAMGLDFLNYFSLQKLTHVNNLPLNRASEQPLPKIKWQMQAVRRPARTMLKYVWLYYF